MSGAPLEVRALTAAERQERAVEQAGRRVLDAISSGDGDRIVQEVLQLVGMPHHAAPAGAPRPKVLIFRWICPPVDLGGCDGSGEEPGGGRCLFCAGAGMVTADRIQDPQAWEGRLRPAPTPPAVMRRPCGDCALRPGSPEQQIAADGDGNPVTAEVPFFCHHGMHRRPGAVYESPAYVGRLPLGAMVCAGWWALVTGGQLPDRPYRELAGADRPQDAPEVGAEGSCQVQR